MRDPQGMVPPSEQVKLQFQQWAWSRYRNQMESGTQEGRTYRGEAAEQDDAAADVVDADDDAAAAAAAVVVVVVAAAAAAAAAWQKPVGTGAAVREGREGEEEEGNEGRTFDIMVHNDGNKMMKCC